MGGLCECELRSIQSALNYHSSTVCVLIVGNFPLSGAVGLKSSATSPNERSIVAHTTMLSNPSFTPLPHRFWEICRVSRARS